MDSPPFNRDWVGRKIDGRFTLIDWLGGSEHSGVYLTELTEGPRTQKAAIKLIGAAGPEADSRIAAWSAAVKLAHPHLLRVFRAGRTQSGPHLLAYVVMQYAEEVLAQVIPERPITAGEATEMLDPLLDVLAYLHRNGFVHGRLKPANILVVDNQLKLSEDILRIGERRRGSQPLTVYDAPETATHPAAPSADLWSLGVSLVEALTQSPPVFDRAAAGDPPIPDSIPEPLSAIAANCLRRSPIRRWSLDQVKDALENKSDAKSGARSASPGLAPVPPGRADRAERPPVRSERAIEKKKPIDDDDDSKASGAKFRGAALIAAALLLVVGLAVFLLRPHHPQTAPSASTPAASTPSAPATSASAPPQSSASAPAPSASAPPQSSAPAPQLPQSQPAQSSPAPSTPAAQTPPASVPAPTPSPAPTPAPAPAPPAATSQPQPTASQSGSASTGQIAQRVLPDVPRKASDSIHGKVEVAVRVQVDAQGQVTGVALASPGPSRYFANLALESSRKWKFTPPRDHSAGSAAWTLRYIFRPSGVDATATPESR